MDWRLLLLAVNRFVQLYEKKFTVLQCQHQSLVLKKQMQNSLIGEVQFSVKVKSVITPFDSTVLFFWVTRESCELVISV